MILKTSDLPSRQKMLFSDSPKELKPRIPIPPQVSEGTDEPSSLNNLSNQIIALRAMGKSEAEINQIVSGGFGSPSGQESLVPLEKAKQSLFGTKDKIGLLSPIIGAGKGTINTIQNLGKFAAEYVPTSPTFMREHLTGQEMPLPFSEEQLKSKNFGESSGKFLEQAGEYLLPASAGLKATKGAKLLTRMAVEGATTGGVAAVQGGDLNENAVMAGAIGAAFPLAGKVYKGAIKPGLQAVKQRIAIKTAKEVEELVGKIAQGKTEDIKIVKRALGSLDTEGVSTFKDLNEVTRTKIGELSRTLDNFLDQIPGKHSLDDMAEVVKVGNRTVEKNFVKEAFEGLEELYKTIGEPENYARILNLKDKAILEGLFVREINQLAREYGTTIGKKGFSKIGEPLTSLNAQRFENVRKGIKEAARSKIDGEAAKIIDSKISDLFDLDMLSEKMIENVNTLSQRIGKRGIIEKLGAKSADVLNAVTFGGVRGLVYRFLVPSGAGFKTMNALDIEKQLGRNLSKLRKLIDGRPENLEKFLIDEIKRQKQFLLPEGKPNLPVGKGRPGGGTTEGVLPLGAPIADEPMARVVGRVKSQPAVNAVKEIEGMVKPSEINFMYNKPKAEAVMKAESEVIEEMFASVKGERLFEGGEFKGSLKSTFPDWVSPELRTKELFDKTINKLMDEKIPTGKGKQLYDEMIAEAKRRLEGRGVEITGAVKDATFKEPLPEFLN